MLKLPKEHLSVSQINLWESDPIAYQKKYFIGIPDPPSPFLEFGKQFAKDIEDYAAGVQRDFNLHNIRTPALIAFCLTSGFTYLIAVVCVYQFRHLANCLSVPSCQFIL